MALMRKVTGKKSRSRSLIDDGEKTQSPRLFLRGLELDEIPGDVFSSPFPQCLEMLDLNNNNLSMIDQRIGIFANLRYLFLAGNQLRLLPTEIGCLRELVTLDLSRNRLQYLPRSINNLKALQVVNLSGNDLKIIPEFLLSLPKLCKVFCIRNLNLENIPKDVASDGLDAMRRYLNIIVEVFESDLEHINMKDARQGCIFSEIEQKWILENEQLTKKTKDVSTQLEEKDPCSRIQVSYTRETSISTQTDLVDNSLDIILPSRQASSLQRLRYHCQTDVEVIQRHKILDEDQAMKELVRLFHKQIQLVAKYRQNPQENIKRKNSYDSVFSHSLSQMSKTRPLCGNCGLQRKERPTSEYGSMSSISRLYDDIIISEEENDDSCNGNDGSHHDDISEIDINDCLMDITSEFELDDCQDEIWCLEECQFLNPWKEFVIRKYGIEMTVPHMNLSGHRHEEFKFQTVNSMEYSPVLDGNMVLATPIVHAAPHGAKFYLQMEAIVKLPLNIVVDETITITCYESNTDLGEPPIWKEISADRFECSFENVTIKTTHFSLFCAIGTKGCPTTRQRISASDGGILTLEEIKDCSVYFPKKALKSEEDISMTVLFEAKQYSAAESTHLAKASPIVLLEPSGIQFEEDVTITLPLPDANTVYEVTHDPKLVIFESQTERNECPQWKELNTKLSINNNNGAYSVSFNVRHFTIFQAVWEGLCSTLEAVKKRAEAFVPHFTYRVYFQALMSDCHHTRQFGLCIICHLAGNPPVTDCSQFPLEVGRSKPRDLSKGNVQIELKSKKFTADLDVGEADGMTKTEKFNGTEFDKQFALIFIEPVKEGNFGKVFVSQKDNSDNEQPVADFLLQKAALRRTLSKRKPTALETKLAQEVAGLLAIEERWKELAIALGYTRNEVNKIFSAENPIEQILAHFLSRGGDENDFIRAMFDVARRMKLIPLDQMMENRENRRMENFIQTPTSSGYCSCQDSPEKTPLKAVKRKMIDRDFDEEDFLTDARLDRIAGWIAEKWKHVGRALGIEQTKISEIELNNRYEGGREKAFQMLAVWKEMYPERCSTSCLKMALAECGLNNTARRLFIH